jgi:hypothetical protein
VGPGIGLDDVERKNNLAPTATRAPNPSTVQLIANRRTYFANPAPHGKLIRTKLTPPSRVILEDLLALFSQSRNFLPFMESEVSFSYSQKPGTGSHPQLYKNNNKAHAKEIGSTKVNGIEIAQSFVVTVANL